MQTRPKFCSSCKKSPQNFLFQSCSHPLCLHCAKTLTEHIRNEYLIVCPICQDQTSLQKQLLSELINLTPPKPLSSRLTPSRNEGPKGYVLQKVNDMINRQDDPFERYCCDHSEFTVLYVCKSCKGKMVCPQCVINGVHRNHEVVGIQKQGELVKEKMQSELNSLNRKMAELRSIERERLEGLRGRVEELERMKGMAKQQYAQIRASLNQQQNIVVSKCNEMILVHTREEQTFKKQIDREMTAYEQVRGGIINLLNPLVKESVLESNRGLQKISYINLITQYNKFNFQHFGKARNDKHGLHNSAEAENNFHDLVGRIQKLKVNNLKENINSQFYNQAFDQTKRREQGGTKFEGKVKITQKPLLNLKNSFQRVDLKRNQYFNLL